MCSKKPLSKQGATAALSLIRSRHNNKKADKKPCRTYYCNECEAWHLTSQTTKQFYIHKKKQQLK